MEEPNQAEWQEPPLPETIRKAPTEPPQMSEVATLGNIFFEPGRVFEDMRRKPRFIIAIILTTVLVGTYLIAFQQKLGEQRLRQFITEQIEKNPQANSLPAEQKKKQIDMGVMFAKYSGYTIPFFLIITSFIGGLIYWLAGKAFGGSATYLQSLSVWVYSTFAPAVVSTLANILVLFLKSPDDIDIATSSRGVIQASPAMLMNGREMPVLTTVVGTFDFFIIWGLVLAAIGLHKVGKISKGSAWAIVLILTLLTLTFRVISSFFSGNPQ